MPNETYALGARFGARCQPVRSYLVRRLYLSGETLFGRGVVGNGEAWIARGKGMPDAPASDKIQPMDAVAATACRSGTGNIPLTPTARARYPMSFAETVMVWVFPLRSSTSTS
jgi:hypothetical protein